MNLGEEWLAFTTESILDKSRDKKHRKSESPLPAASPLCPECTSRRVWRDGVRYTRHGDVQRYLCRSCGYRFSDPKVKVHVTAQRLKMPNSGKNHMQTSVFKSDSPLKKTPEKSSLFIGKDVRPHFSSPQGSVTEGLNSLRFYNSKHQVCVNEEKMKNLVKVETRIEKRAAGATTNLNQAEMKGKIVDFAWWLKKGGYAETTILVYTNVVEVLAKRGANILDPESVKDTIARQKWQAARKNVVVQAYTLFLKTLGITWEPPICERPTRKLPFLPLESEIDQLIAACGKKTTAFLQLLKETAMRVGEANKLEWTDIDFARKAITLNNPEKNGNPRMFKVSTKLLNMLSTLPKKDQRVFGNCRNWHQATFSKSRKRIAGKLGNPRILKIHFHTLRHWKATMLYHRTKDILYVKQFLGHKRIEDTLLYVQIAEVIFKETNDEFTVRVATKPEEIKALLEVGFEYVCEKDGLVFFRKRK